MNYPATPEELDLELAKTKVKFIAIETEPYKNASEKGSKMGGIPYWDKNLSYPTINGKPAKMLAQINFEEIPETIKITDFPKKGILQFFCEYSDDMWGLTFDGSPSNIKIIYHPQLSDISYIDNKIREVAQEESDMPYNEECVFKFSQKEELLGLGDEYNAIRKYSFKSENLSEELNEYLWDNNENNGSKIGGYAYFTQSDPRDMKKEIDWVLLLQLDTDDNMMWGDCGVGNWFISREDLKALNFNNVLFNWDCC